MHSKLLLLILFFLGFLSCKNEGAEKPVLHRISGQTMGTNYNISYLSNDPSVTKVLMDSILIDINNAVSTYIPESRISQFNMDSMALNYSDIEEVKSLIYASERNIHFENNFRIAKDIYTKTQGFFDPSIMPLVNYWGFGYKDKKAVLEIDSVEVRSLAKLCDFSQWKISTDSSGLNLTKPLNAELDFSAVAKGYAVDVLAEFLQNNGITNYMVEIGGEIFCSGNNGNSDHWKIGLSKPEIAASIKDLQSIIQLSDKAMASSGNYRNYYDVNGRIYGHEINPLTGFPEINELLGVTVLADNCAEADALATAFMVMGKSRTMEWLSLNSDVESVLFFRSENGEIDQIPLNGIDQYLEKLSPN